jgi:hypothetical protein
MGYNFQVPCLYYNGSCTVFGTAGRGRKGARFCAEPPKRMLPGLKPTPFLRAFAAWLKPCPDTKPSGRDLCFPTLRVQPSRGRRAVRVGPRHARSGWGAPAWLKPCPDTKPDLHPRSPSQCSSHDFRRRHSSPRKKRCGPVSARFMRAPRTAGGAKMQERRDRVPVRCGFPLTRGPLKRLALLFQMHRGGLRESRRRSRAGGRGRRPWRVP